jgi:hypothetical protein
MLHGILQVLHDTLLTNHLLDPSLCLDVKWIFIQPLNSLLTLHPFPPLPVEAGVEQLSKPLGILQRVRHLGLLPLELRSQMCVAQDL